MIFRDDAKQKTVPGAARIPNCGCGVAKRSDPIDERPLGRREDVTREGVEKPGRGSDREGESDRERRLEGEVLVAEGGEEEDVERSITRHAF